MSVKSDIISIREKNCLNNPRFMQIEITNKCALSCPQCYKIPVNMQKFMDLDDYKHHIDEAFLLGVKGVSLMGGEPFAHNNIIEMIRYAAEYDIEVTIFTSGCYLREEVVSQLKNIKKITLLISLNGSSDEINSKSRDGYNASVNAAKVFEHNNIPFGINWVARHDNVLDFEDLIKFSKKLGANFINVVANKLTGGIEIDSPLTRKDYEVLFDVISREKSSGFITIQKCYDILLSKVLNYPRTILSGCQAGISVCAVNLDNLYMPCLHLIYPEEFNSIKEYWEKSEVLKKLRNKDKKNAGYCVECEYVEECKYCRAMSIESHKNFNSGIKNCCFNEEKVNYEIIKV